jgi:RNA polymerase sporulation-specific sigma factor
VPDLADLTDAELVRAFREGRSDRAFEQLLGRYVRLIRSWARKYWCAYRIADCDDLEQEARIAFLGAVNSYDQAQSGFFGFAQLCVTRRLKSVVKSAGRLRNCPPPGAVILSTGMGSGMGASDGDDRDMIEAVPNPAACDPLDLAVANDAARRLWSVAGSALSGLELEALKRRAWGESYQEVAAELGVSQKSIDNAVTRARRKLRGLIESDGGLLREEDESA